VRLMVVVPSAKVTDLFVLKVPDPSVDLLTENVPSPFLESVMLPVFVLVNPTSERALAALLIFIIISSVMRC
jgi:hypothetical protein